MVKKNTSDGTGKKMFESKYDADALRKMIVEDKMTADEIQEKLGIASKQSLRQHVMRLCNEDRSFYELPGLYKQGNTKLPMVNFKGEIRLTKKMLSGEFKHEDRFNVEIVDSNKVVLTKVVQESKEDSGSAAGAVKTEDAALKK